MYEDMMIGDCPKTVRTTVFHIRFNNYQMVTDEPYLFVRLV